MAIWQPHRLEEQKYELPALVKPEGPGYMPLYFTAQWIATRGGTLEIDPSDLSVWQDAFAQLLPRIASDELIVTGMRDGQREKLEGHIFVSIRVDFPFHDTPFNLLVSEELYLRSCVYIDEEHWQKGWNDVLEARHGAKWSKLMVLKSDVARRWPFGVSQFRWRSRSGFTIRGHLEGPVRCIWLRRNTVPGAIEERPKPASAPRRKPSPSGSRPSIRMCHS
jgi:hypothetical protein